MTYEEACIIIAKENGMTKLVTGNLKSLFEQAAKLYAKSACEEQRRLCAEYGETAGAFASDFDCFLIGNAPAPELH